MEKALVVVPGAWSPRTAELLAPALRHDPTTSIRLLEERCARDAALFHVMSGDDIVAAFVATIDPSNFADELVVIAAGGRVPGISLLRSVLPWIESTWSTCSAVRIHTARRGMLRELSKRGYKAREIVMVKELA